MPRKYDAIVFDFDGTVADTGPGIIKSLIYSLEKNGVEIPGEEQLRRFIGPPIYDSFINDYGATETTVGEFIFRYRERYFDKGIYECEIYDGVRELLASLRENGYVIGIASSKPQKLIYDVMNYTKIRDYFDCICGTDLDESKHTTKAELITRCAQELGIGDMSKVLMVGDRCFDLDGAREAGADSAGMLYGYGSRKEFTEHNATYIFENAGELQALLCNT